MDKKNFVYCEKCRKKLIERLPNGLWKFIFGKKSETSNNPPVVMMIHGSLRMKCIRRTCGHWNVMNYFPKTEIDLTNQQEAEDSGKNNEIKNKEL